MDDKRTQMMAPDGKPRFVDSRKVPEFQEKGWRVCPQYMPEAYYPQFDQALNPNKDKDDPRKEIFMDKYGFDEGKLGIIIV